MLKCITSTNPLEVENINNAQRENNYLKFWFHSGVFKYQENPVLLDPILPDVTKSIFDMLQKFKIENGHFVNGPGYLQQCQFLAKGRIFKIF